MLSLAGFRDAVRRRLDITPLIDVSGLPTDTGSPYSSQPYPSNQQLNDAINSAISTLNAVVRCGNIENVVSLDVQPCPANWRGPQFISLQSSDIIEPFNVVYNDVLNRNVRLTNAKYYAKSRGAEPFRQYPAGSPQMWWMAGNSLAVVPGCSVPAQITLAMSGTVPALVTDTDVVQYIPASLQEYITLQAAVVISMMRTRDIDASTRIQAIQPVAQMFLEKIVAWRAGEVETVDTVTTEE